MAVTSIAATSASIPTAFGPSEIGQNPSTLPAIGPANVTSSKTITAPMPTAIFGIVRHYRAAASVACLRRSVAEGWPPRGDEAIRALIDARRQGAGDDAC